jgi:hypothetical protein
MAEFAVAKFCATSPLYEVLTRGDDKEAQAAKDEADAERLRLAEFEDRAVAGEIGAETFARVSARIEARIAELDRKAHELSAPPALRGLESSAATEEERFADILGRFRAMPVPAQRAVIKSIFSPVLYPASGSPADMARFRMPLAPGLL